MYKGKSNLAVIIARGGSKGLPGKNLRALGGKPLIAWTIEAAARSRYLDRVVLSSDDAQIIAVARRWGCEVPFVRPAHLAADDVPAVDPLLHAAQFVGGADYVTLLQPTSPFRTSADIDGCIARCIDSGAPSCVTVAPVRKSPAWMFHLEADQLRPVLGGSVDVYLRQQLPPAFALKRGGSTSSTSRRCDARRR